jgi:pimeloyl-ACP methyl ester carboxylesterase
MTSQLFPGVLLVLSLAFGVRRPAVALSQRYLIERSAVTRRRQAVALQSVRSKDDTLIAYECQGKGPTLLIVHGGTGDHTRWTPLFPFLESRFTVCAMDRRGHGNSEPGSNYSLQKEIEDVLAVVNSRPGPVFVLGHSIGGVFALEAALQTNKISKLVLYEPPLQDGDHTAIADQMQTLIKSGKRELALEMFLSEIVKVSPKEIEVMKARPSWPNRVASIDIQIREIRALSKYGFDGKRFTTLHTQALLLAGSNTRSPQLKQAIKLLKDTLPNWVMVELEGQEHNAMDTIPKQFAQLLTKFLLVP